MKTQWKDVVGFEGLYAVSDAGEVYSYYLNRNRKLRTRKEGDGLDVGLSINGIQTFHFIHRLVVAAFIKPDLRLEEDVTHLDGDVKNNSETNLRVFSSTERRTRKSQNTPEGLDRCVGVRKRGENFTGYYYDNDNKQVYVGTFSSKDAAISAVSGAILNDKT